MSRDDRRIAVLRYFIVLMVAAVFLSLFTHLQRADVVEALSRKGSRGEEVRKIQTVLQREGYYKGAIDGIFGSGTETAVRAYQRAKGLAVDGVVGPATLKAMGLTSQSTGATFSDNEVQLLARLISAEARGEPYSGQVAVGAVVLNRVQHPSFPDTISGVIYQSGAFTAVRDSNWSQPVVESARRAARDAMNGWDPSGGATYYYVPAKTTNPWMLSLPVIKVIGQHNFCRGKS